MMYFGFAIIADVYNNFELYGRRTGNLKNKLFALIGTELAELISLQYFRES